MNSLLGFPRALEPGGAVMNLPLVRVLGTDPLDAERYRQLNLQLGLLSSALEHAVPEQLFTTDPTNPADAVSAVKALAKANAVEQRLYHLTPTNLSETLPHIHHDEAVLEEIRTAVQHGREVITHTDAISVPGWRGAGYIILDPETGEGAYKIGGGQNGSWVDVAGIIVSAAPIWVTISIVAPQIAVIFNVLMATATAMLIYAAALGNSGYHEVATLIVTAWEGSNPQLQLEASSLPV